MLQHFLYCTSECWIGVFLSMMIGNLTQKPYWQKNIIDKDTIWQLRHVAKFCLPNRNDNLCFSLHPYSMTYTQWFIILLRPFRKIQRAKPAKQQRDDSSFSLVWLILWKPFFRHFSLCLISFRIQNIPFRFEAKQAKLILFFAISLRSFVLPFRFEAKWGDTKEYITLIEY